MKITRQTGLIVEGNSTRSVVLRLPGLLDEIGPIKGTTIRVGKRVSNFFHAGRAVNDYEDLQNCDLVLMRLPDESVARVVKEICNADWRLTGTAFVLFESWLDSSILQPLAERGAAVATIVEIPANRHNWFAIEGQYVAVKRAKRLFDKCQARTLELKPGTKYFYFAASTLASKLPRALFAAANKALRSSGVNGKHLYVIVEEMAQTMFQDVSRGSRGGWNGPMLECPTPLANQYLKQLKESSPDLAQFLDAQIDLAEPYVPKRGPWSPKDGDGNEPLHSMD